MKKIVKCLSCNKATRFYGSYSAELEERIVATLTGEIKKHKVIGKICYPCAVKAGYKDRRRKEDDSKNK